MADREIFSLDMDNLEQFPVDLDDNNENFNVNLDNEDQNFNLNATSEDEDFEVEFGEVTNLGTTDYNAFQNKPQINGVTLEGNKTTEDLGIETDSYYDASWVLTQAQATPEQYNALLEAANNNQRVVVAVDSEHYYVPEISADQDNISMAF